VTSSYAWTCKGGRDQERGEASISFLGPSPFSLAWFQSRCVVGISAPVAWLRFSFASRVGGPATALLVAGHRLSHPGGPWWWVMRSEPCRLRIHVQGCERRELGGSVRGQKPEHGLGDTAEATRPGVAKRRHHPNRLGQTTPRPSGPARPERAGAAERRAQRAPDAVDTDRLTNDETAPPLIRRRALSTPGPTPTERPATGQPPSKSGDALSVSLSRRISVRIWRGGHRYFELGRPLSSLSAPR
jgi:hypothetical protein